MVVGETHHFRKHPIYEYIPYNTGGELFTYLFSPQKPTLFSPALEEEFRHFAPGIFQDLKTSRCGVIWVLNQK